VFGGTFFLGAFLYSLGTLHAWARAKGEASTRPCGAYAPRDGLCRRHGGGMLSLSRVYNLTPYLLLGVVTVYLGLVSSSAPALVPRLTPRLIGRLLMHSLLFLCAVTLFVRLVAGTG